MNLKIVRVYVFATNFNTSDSYYDDTTFLLNRFCHMLLSTRYHGGVNRSDKNASTITSSEKQLL